MKALYDMLRVQARLHRKQGANALGDLFENANKEMERLEQQLKEANERVKELEERHLNLVLWHNLDPQQAKNYSVDYINQFAIEQQMKGIDDAIKNAPSRLRYRLPLIEITDLYDYQEQLRKEQEND